MEKLVICRTHRSPYQAPDFHLQEKLAIESLGHSYTADASKANVLITNTHTQLESFDLSKLKLIIHPNSGFDNFDYLQAKNCPCPIILGNPVRANGVSNYILSCLFSHFSLPPKQHCWDKQRLWPRRLTDQLHIQLIGHGHIGKILSTTLAPLVKKLSIYDPFKKEFSSEDNLRWHDSDVIIFACGLNSSSRKILSTKQLAQLKSDVLIINPARGELIDQESLFSFLQSHPQSFAYLDVFEKEPAELEKWQLSNVHLSSHIAGVSADLDQRIINYVRQCLQDFTQLGADEFNRHYHSLILQQLKEGEWK